MMSVLVMERPVPPREIKRQRESGDLPYVLAEISDHRVQMAGRGVP